MKNVPTKPVIALAVIGILIAFVIFARRGGDTSESPLRPVDAISHGHGLAVDVADPNKVYIATHHGLLVLVNDKDLYRIGTRQDDDMGFSVHPTDPRVFFTSGHPRGGGNLGFQKSEDGGVTWQRVSNGVNGPVDFHAMAVSPTKPNIVYGWYRGLQRSTDSGKTWEVLNANVADIISLTAHPVDENVVYAATAQGLLRSSDKGDSWERVSDELRKGAVVTLAIHPQDPQRMLSFSQNMGLTKSVDGGRTWEKVNEEFGGDFVLYLAIDRKKPETVYALTRNNVLYKSTDGWNRWNKIR